MCSKISKHYEDSLLKYSYSYCKVFSLLEALIYCIERWKTMRNKNKYSESIFLDLLFVMTDDHDYISCAKLHVYGITKNSCS